MWPQVRENEGSEAYRIWVTMRTLDFLSESSEKQLKEWKARRCQSNCLLFVFVFSLKMHLDCQVENGLGWAQTGSEDTS